MAQLFAKPLLPEVHDHLEMTGHLGHGTLSERAGALVRSLARHDEMRSLIDHIVSDDVQLAEIAARSYYHANSFLKLVLAVGSENTWKLRLHVWHPQAEEDREPREDIHSHRWDFTTALLLGEYNAREYMIAPGGEEYHHYKYTPVRADQFFALESMGTDQLAQVFESNLQAGTVYHLDHRVLHSIARSYDGPTATVVLQGPTVRNSTNVYRTTPVGEESGGRELGKRRGREIQKGGGKEIYVERPSVEQLRAELIQLRDWL
ncbi:hypothetical protein ACN6LC_003770 [Streptomyces violaceoruber]|uniref:hypothetical protein n=1 Tax=Streptomyces violaceoruber TaxID=1935 RepID=UPI00403CE83C